MCGALLLDIVLYLFSCNGDTSSSIVCPVGLIDRGAGGDGVRGMCISIVTSSSLLLVLGGAAAGQARTLSLLFLLLVMALFGAAEEEALHVLVLSVDTVM